MFVLDTAKHLKYPSAKTKEIADIEAQLSKELHTSLHALFSIIAPRNRLSIITVNKLFLRSLLILFGPSELLI
jgi:hypothetical protein